MTVQTTIDKLREMKMTAMAENYRFQLEDRSFRDLSFDERSPCLWTLNTPHAKTTGSNGSFKTRSLISLR